MSIDILILNTAVADFRSDEFTFTEKLAGPGGLARCKTKDMPAYTQKEYKQWIDKGMVTAGGPGNTAPLIAKAGLKVAVGVNLGQGDFDGLDAQGRFFYDMMTRHNVDMSQTFVHPKLPTGTTFIYEKVNHERGGIAYFPNANNDFDFEYFKKSVETLSPKIVFYMYSGLSDRGDASEGKDLANFIKWCRQKGIVTIIDSHTLTGNPQKLIEEKAVVPEYKLLEPLLPELDIFFTSYDEARMIANTLGENIPEHDFIVNFLKFLSKEYKNFKIFGVTVKDGAYITYKDANGNVIAPKKITSRFMGKGVTDLVGAGDSFRAGVVTYIAKNIDEFKNGKIDIEQAIQMGNLFASLYIKAPLNSRYGSIENYGKMLEIIK
ncbi:MAG: carbohydrate kinase family protein [Planctomycetaceae bacterium]|nr:carbohydrate kinase family protein [Planctomycetaceae bacterium]